MIKKRTFVKAVTWEGSGVLVLVCLGLPTDLSVIYVIIRMLMYVAHEQLWKSRWMGRLFR